MTTYQELNPNSERSPFPKMDPDLKAKWTAALRSGEYQQGTGALTHIPPGEGGAKHCCLGVLCDIGVKDGVMDTQPSKWEDHTSYRPISPDGGDADWVDVLPSGLIRTWAGLSAGAVSRLVRMNDSRNYSFSEIADWIDENL